MPGRLVLKRLTASDLTFFAYQLQTAPAGKQKALNMNKDVFVDVLFPALRNVPLTARYPIDLYLYGPGLAGELNLQRKILLQEKNWRLNGEVVHNPDGEPNRFDVLSPGDIAVLEFNSGTVPDAVRIVFIAVKKAEDVAIHAVLNILLGTTKMMEVPSSDLENAVRQANVAPNHPILGLAIGTELESIALGSEKAVDTILAIPSRPLVSHEALDRARESASRIGLFGEQLVSDYFQAEKEAGHIVDFEWVSRNDAISPFDFWYSPDGQQRILVDVKTTSGPFDKPIHISSPELRQIVQGSEQYDIYRVYSANEAGSTGQLRIVTGLRPLAEHILLALNSLPPGVFADGVSFSPLSLPHEPKEPIRLALAGPEDE